MQEEYFLGGNTLEGERIIERKHYRDNKYSWGGGSLNEIETLQKIITEEKTQIAIKGKYSDSD